MRQFLGKPLYRNSPGCLGQESQFIQVFNHLGFGLIFLNHRHQYGFLFLLYLILLVNHNKNSPGERGKSKGKNKAREGLFRCFTGLSAVFIQTDWLLFELCFDLFGSIGNG